MAKKIVTLYIDDTSLRLTVTKGRQIKGWAETPLEAGLVKNNVIVEEDEVADKIRQLFKIQKVKTKKISVGISGLHCLTRPITLPQLPKVMLAEAVMREAKRTLPVPPEQLYISWQTMPAPAGKIQVFLVAIPRKTADVLFKLLHQVGLKPYFLDLKPLILAKMVKKGTAVIVDVQTNEFDIVIMTDGTPQPIRTIALPSEAQSWQEKITMIGHELDRTIKFYNSNNQENQLDKSIPIFASGELAHEPKMCQALSDNLGHPVLLLSSPLDCPGELDPSRYIANIGLALRELPSRNGAGFPVADLNALPTPYRPKSTSLAKALVLPGIATAITVIALIIMLIQGTSANTASIRGQLDTTNQLLTQKLAERKALTDDIAELEKKITKIEASRDNFARALDSLEKQKNEINRNLEVTIRRLSGTIHLSSIAYVNNKLTIIGNSPSEQEILSYLKQLDDSGSFGEITITNMSRTKDKGVDFTMVLSQGGQG